MESMNELKRKLDAISDEETGSDRPIKRARGSLSVFLLAGPSSQPFAIDGDRLAASSSHFQEALSKPPLGTNPILLTCGDARPEIVRQFVRWLEGQQGFKNADFPPSLRRSEFHALAELYVFAEKYGVTDLSSPVFCLLAQEMFCWASDGSGSEVLAAEHFPAATIAFLWKNVPEDELMREEILKDVCRYLGACNEEMNDLEDILTLLPNGLLVMLLLEQALWDFRRPWISWE